MLSKTVRSFSVVLVAACASAERPAMGGFTRSDSAGFTIATNTAAATELKPVFTVDSAPRLRIGVEAGAEPLQFDQVTGVARLDDGRIAIANGRPAEVRIFTPSGEFLSSVGRAGQGPGEFQRLSRVIAGTGDTLFAVDPMYMRIHQYTIGGGHVGTTTASLDSILRAMAPMTLAEGMTEPFRNGSVVVEGQPPTDGPLDGSQFPTGELFRRREKAVWISADYSRSVVIGDVLGIQQMFIDMGGGRRSAEIPPSSRWQQTGIGARGTKLCTAGNETPEIRCVEQDGRVTIIRWTQEPVPTSQETIDAWKTRARERAGRSPAPGAKQNAERVIAGMIVPPTVPPIAFLFVDAEGGVLVGSPDLKGGRPGWNRLRVFSPDGELLGYADVPQIWIGDLGDDYLLGRSFNEDGVEFVVGHDVRRP